MASRVSMQSIKGYRDVPMKYISYVSPIRITVEKNGDFGSNLDTNQPETQMQRAKRLGLKVDADKVFEMEKADKEEGLPKVHVQRTKLKVYIPQAERESTSSARSSCNAEWL